MAAQAAPRGTRCEGKRIAKSGKNPCGHQQFRCRARGACRVLAPKSRPATPERRAEVLRAVASERLSLRAAAWVFGAGRNTVTDWLEKKRRPSRRYATRFCLPKRATGWNWPSFGALSAPTKANVRWVWIALCRQTRQAVAFCVGDPFAQSARALRERLPPGCRCRATRSDFWLAYEEAFPPRPHRMCGRDEGQTNHAERFCCTLRQRLGRFVRQILSFSKCDRMPELALRLFVHQYNQHPIR